MTDFIKCKKCGKFKKETFEVYGDVVDWNEEPCECDENEGFYVERKEYYTDEYIN